MILKQYYLGCLAHASYLIGDEKSGVAAVVDPQRDVDQYLEDARAQGLRIAHVLLTHFHADFVAGHLELRERAGAKIHLGAAAEAEYDFEPAHDGDRIALGDVTLGILATPGHTPEGISILVWDANGSAAHPHAVLTGDTLFIGDVGRPDLMASVGVTADELAGKLYDSLHDKLLRLPDETLVYPAHGAGSMCGKNLSRETSSSLGQQRRYNYALQPMARAHFIQLVTSDQPEAPAYFSHDAMLNRQERPLLAETLQKVLSPMSLTEVLAQRAAGAQVLDVRDPTEWAGAHLPGSINIGLGGQFATWSGTLLDHDIPIVIIAEPGRETEAATRLGRIGFDHVLGYLDGGMQALDGMPDRVQSLERWTAVALSESLESPDAPLVLDVRNDGEWRTKHIAGSLHIPLAKLESRRAEVPRGRPVVVYCGSGYRSMMAASILERDGLEAVSDLVGGISAWEKSALPVTAEPA